MKSLILSSDPFRWLQLKRMRAKKFQDEWPSPAELVGVPHIRATIQHSRPARVVRAVSATFSFASTSIKANRAIRDLTAVGLGPAFHNTSGTSVVKGLAVARGREALISPIAGGYSKIIETSNK